MAPSRWRILEGKTAAITGGTTGIGRAIALEYLRQGCNVAINHLGLERDEVYKDSLLKEAAVLKAEKVEGESTSKAGDLLEIVGDVTKAETGELLVQKAVEKWGKLDIFVANAGIFQAADFLTLDHELFDRTVRINLNGAFYTCQAAARQMVKQGHGGSIIGISSISALVGGGLQTHYTPTKAGVLSLIQSMAIALAKDKIRCNAILPGTIKTQLADEDMKNDVKRKYLEERIPMGRVGNPEDVAGPAVFLASEELSPYCNGTQLLADGGIIEEVFRPSKILMALTPGPARNYQPLPQFDDFSTKSPHGAPLSRNSPMAEEERPLSRKPRHRQSRGRGLRKTTGCITCRRRHVKCDELRPHCHRCNKGGQTCIYADKRPEPSGRIENRSSEAISDPPPAPIRQPIPPWQTSPEQTHYSKSLLENGCPGSVETPNFQRHPSTTSANGFALGNQATAPLDTAAQQVMSPEMSHAGTAFSFGSNDNSSLAARSVSSQPTFNVAITRWFDMLVGDSAFENGFADFDIGMDEPNNFGTPREQDRMGVPYMEPYNSTPTTAALDSASPSSSSPQLIERSAPGLDRSAIAEKSKWQTPEAIELLPYEQLIFRNFVQRTSHWIDLFDLTQSFSTFVPHLAMRNIGLMKAILALSARHISLNPGIIPEQTHDRNDALQYYNETLHYLSKAMQYDTYKTSLELLATALIVSTYEMLDGSGKDWERHLQGVFWIQRSQVIHGDSKGLKQAVWWAWLQQDVWAAFREKRKTFTFWKPTRRFDDMNPYELAARSVYVIAKVVNYCSREETEAEDISLRIERADQLQAMLDEWELYLTTEFTMLPFKTGEEEEEEEEEAFEPIWIHPPAFGVALQLHYSARLLLLLNKPSRGGFGGYLEQSRLISKFVNNICGIAMTLTDHASSVMCSQCLYIAGMCIQDVRRRETVLKMLDACRQRTGWPILSLGEELQTFWKTSETMPNG